MQKENCHQDTIKGSSQNFTRRGQTKELLYGGGVKKKKKRNRAAVLGESNLQKKSVTSLFPISMSVGERVQTWSINRRCPLCSRRAGSMKYEGAGRRSLQFDTE